MLESLLFWLTVAFVVVIVLAPSGYFALRWVFMRAAEQMAAIVDRSVGGVAARAFTRLARFAQARGIGVDEAQRIFRHPDRSAGEDHGQRDHAADRRPGRP